VAATKTDQKTDLGAGVKAGLSSMLRGVSAAPDSTPPFPEHARVRAVTEIREGDQLVPAGASGTVVHVFKDGAGYDVEFTAPVHVVISALRRELAPA